VTDSGTDTPKAAKVAKPRSPKQASPEEVAPKKSRRSAAEKAS
jgi:hypothetical protein